MLFKRSRKIVNVWIVYAKGNEIISYYISREVFGIILEGLKSKGYKKFKG